MTIAKKVIRALMTKEAKTYKQLVRARIGKDQDLKIDT